MMGNETSNTTKTRRRRPTSTSYILRRTCIDRLVGYNLKKNSSSPLFVHRYLNIRLCLLVHENLRSYVYVYAYASGYARMESGLKEFFFARDNEDTKIRTKV